MKSADQLLELTAAIDERRPGAGSSARVAARHLADLKAARLAAA